MGGFEETDGWEMSVSQLRFGILAALYTGLGASWPFLHISANDILFSLVS